jgi:heptosyltransferase-2
MRDRLVALLAHSLDRAARSRSNTIALDPSTIQRILVVKPCCFGDVMMATPALRSLKHRFPDARIDVLTTVWCAEALRNNPNVNGVYRYPDSVTLVRLLRVARKVRQQHYDLGVSLDRSPTVNALLLFSGIPERAGIDSAGRGIGLTVRVNPQAPQHETELYLSVAESIGAASNDFAPQYCVSQEAHTTADKLLSGLSCPVVVIHPGGAVNPGATMLSKRWPPERFGELASELILNHGAHVVVVGAESDQDATQGTVDFTDAEVTDLSGRLTIPELAAICERAQLYVGNDSGMSHLASAVGTPTVTIFGPTSPTFYRPLGANARVCAPTIHSRDTSIARDLRRSTKSTSPEADISRVTVHDVLQTCVELLNLDDGSKHGA